MITGEYKNSLDDKGRLLLPAKVRNEIAGNILVLTRGVDKCLWLFPPEEWKSFSENLLKSASILQKKALLIQRWIIAPAQELEFDKTGRITIPHTLREFAGLQKDCIVLGIQRYLEIWDEGAYKSFWNENEAEFRQAAEELGGLVSF